MIKQTFELPPARVGAQLNEFFLGLQRRAFGKLFLEELDRPAERADLVAPRPARNVAVEIAMCDLEHGVGELFERRRDPAERHVEDQAEHAKDQDRASGRADEFHESAVSDAGERIFRREITEHLVLLVKRPVEDKLIARNDVGLFLVAAFEIGCDFILRDRLRMFGVGEDDAARGIDDDGAAEIRIAAEIAEPRRRGRKIAAADDRGKRFNIDAGANNPYNLFFNSLSIYP